MAINITGYHANVRSCRDDNIVTLHKHIVYPITYKHKCNLKKYQTVT